jgi:hypothetical protein
MASRNQPESTTESADGSDWSGGQLVALMGTTLALALVFLYFVSG